MRGWWRTVEAMSAGSRLLAAARLAAVVGVSAGGVAVLHRLGARPYFRIDWTDLGGWLGVVPLAADSLGVGIQIHTASRLSEIEMLRGRYGKSPIEMLDETGCLAPSTILGHCVFVRGHSQVGGDATSDLGLIARAGTAVILSSHLLHLVEELCDRILLIHGGRAVALGPIRDIVASRPELEGRGLEDVFLALTEAGS